MKALNYNFPSGPVDLTSQGFTFGGVLNAIQSDLYTKGANVDYGQYSIVNAASVTVNRLLTQAGVDWLAFTQAFSFATLAQGNASTGPTSYAVSATGGALSVGSNTITLAPVPPGVNAANPNYSVALSGGTGTAETCAVTGGTAVAGASSGTLIITCANAHSGAWLVSSAVAGMAEARASVASALGTFGSLPTGYPADLAWQAPQVVIPSVVSAPAFASTVYDPTFAVNVVFDGDSLTWGYNGGGAQVNWPTTLAVPSYPEGVSRITNVAIPGRSLWLSQFAGLMAEGPGKVDSLLSPYAPWNILFIYAGTNDGVSADGNVIFARVMAYCQARRRAGWKVIVGSMISHTGAGDTQKNQYNPLLYANWPLFADGIADYRSSTLLGADGAYSNATYFQSDGVHLTSAGYSLMAGIAQTALTRLCAGYLQFSGTVNAAVGIGCAPSTLGLEIASPHGCGIQLDNQTDGSISKIVPDTGGLFISHSSGAIALNAPNGVNANGGVQAVGSINVTCAVGATGQHTMTESGTGAKQWTMEIFNGDVYFYDVTDAKFVLTLRKSGVIEMPNLPTSSSGLTAGQVWRNGSVVTIV